MRVSKYLEIFYDEAKKNIIEINRILNLLEKAHQDMDLVTELFIKLHNLKGHSSGMGFRAIESMTLSLHEIFKKVREGELILSDFILREIKAGVVILEELIHALKSGEKVRYLVGKARLGQILIEV